MDKAEYIMAKIASGDLELEKTAFFNSMMYLRGLRAFGKTNTAKYFRGISKAYRKGGVGKVLSRMAKYRDPFHVVGKKGIGTSSVSKMYMTAKPTLARGFRTSLGNLAYNLQTLGKGVPQAGALAPFRIAKNLGSLSIQQLRAAKYRSVDSAARLTKQQAKALPGGFNLEGLSNVFKRRFRSGIIKDKSGQEFYKTWTGLKPRKVLGTTVEGTKIIEKRNLSKPLAMAFTGPGFAAQALAFGDKKKPASERAVKALGEGALWTAAPQVGSAMLIKDMFKM